MNTTLSLILAALLGGAAVNSFVDADIEGKTEAAVASVTTAQLDQAIQLSEIYGYDDTPEQAWERHYGAAE